MATHLNRPVRQHRLGVSYHLSIFVTDNDIACIISFTIFKFESVLILKARYMFPVIVCVDLLLS